MGIRDYYIAREAAIPDIEMGGAPEVPQVVHQYPIESTPSPDELGTLPPPEQGTQDTETHIREGEMQGERQGEMGTGV
jgi:hypothetical protein